VFCFILFHSTFPTGPLEKNPASGNKVFVYNDKKGTEGPGDSHLQWQLNLLTHIENVQNEVTSRMDLIEKEVDGNVAKSSCVANVMCVVLL
jgi:PHD finger protein 20